MQKLLRPFLIFVAIYLIVDGLIHLFNIRLSQVWDVWPKSALSYATLLNLSYASFVFLAAGLLLIAQKDVKKYKAFLKVSAFWAFMHGGLLVYLSLTQDFAKNLSGIPSLYVWIPFYDQYLLFEAFLAFSYACVIFIYNNEK